MYTKLNSSNYFIIGLKQEDANSGKKLSLLSEKHDPWKCKSHLEGFSCL